MKRLSLSAASAPNTLPTTPPPSLVPAARAAALQDVATSTAAASGVSRRAKRKAADAALKRLVVLADSADSHVALAASFAIIELAYPEMITDAVRDMVHSDNPDGSALGGRVERGSA